MATPSAHDADGALGCGTSMKRPRRKRHRLERGLPSDPRPPLPRHRLSQRPLSHGLCGEIAALEAYPAQVEPTYRWLDRGIEEAETIGQRPPSPLQWRPRKEGRISERPRRTDRRR